MGNALLFPDDALALLRLAPWDPMAEMHYDGFAGGLLWTDEFPPDVISACDRAESWAYRVVIAYRASLIEDQPRDELRATWEQLLCACPNWPGFRPDRCSPELRNHLAREGKRFIRRLDALDRLCRRDATSGDERKP